MAEESSRRTEGGLPILALSSGPHCLALAGAVVAEVVWHQHQQWLVIRHLQNAAATATTAADERRRVEAPRSTQHALRSMATTTSDSDFASDSASAVAAPAEGVQESRRAGEQESTTAREHEESRRTVGQEAPFHQKLQQPFDVGASVRGIGHLAQISEC